MSLLNIDLRQAAAALNGATIPLGRTRFTIRLTDADHNPVTVPAFYGAEAVVKATKGVTDQTGIATVDIPPNTDLTGVTGAYWTLEAGGIRFLVNKGQGPENLVDCIAGATTTFSPALRLVDLTDVDVTGLADGDALTWDAGSAKWVPTTGGGGGVSSVTGTAPIVSSGGATPAISITAASAGSAGSMSAADKSKLDGIEAGATGDQTAAEILAKLVTVDGTGSGLVADLHAATHGAGQPDAITISATQISDVLADGQLPSSIARDAEVTAAVSAAVSALVASAPGTLDTLDEIAAALGDDPNFVTTITTLIGTKIAASLYDANTILAANSDNTPAALTVGEATIVGRATGGNIAALTAAQIKTILAITLADLATQAANTVLVNATTGSATPTALAMGASTILARLAAGNIVAATPAEMRTLLDVPTNAEAILDTLLSAQGDLLYASGANTPARLAKGTAYQRLRMNLGATAPEWATVGELLATKVYDPGTTTTYTTTSATLGDIDATNLVVTFTAPASGSVVVMLTGRITTSAATTPTWGLRNGSSQAGGLFTLASSLNLGGAHQARTGVVYITSLTPGTSYTVKWAWAVSGGITFGLKAGQTAGDEGAATMQVFSA